MSKYKIISILVIITFLWQNLLGADMLRPRAAGEREDRFSKEDLQAAVGKAKSFYRLIERAQESEVPLEEFNGVVVEYEAFRNEITRILKKDLLKELLRLYADTETKQLLLDLLRALRRIEHNLFDNFASDPNAFLEALMLHDSGELEGILRSASLNPALESI